ncbi:hypothetical protein QTI66_19370 [Variovorax sp. J22R133]|uniref:hypothetical protein n=1 Tax=Variovorax brevis TaxID=3053503 RepID=UPI0025777B91|nr:hypothetical protein [Variovorax sp. J22R133]MDM0114323.1 hypothetical protein [Variovorax sp. J22R133]
MWKATLLCLLLWTALSAQSEIVFVKKSELWAFELNQQLSKNIDDINRHAEDHVRYMRWREEQGRSLRQQIQACGNCADRDRLVAALNDLEASNRRHDQLLCGTIEAQKSFSPAMAPIEKLMGLESFCAKVIADRDAAQERQEAEQIIARMKAGDANAYGEWGMKLMYGKTGLPTEVGRNDACPLFYQGARQGDVVSTRELARHCLGSSTSAMDRRMGLELLQACAARGEPECLYQLGALYSPSYDAQSRPPPLVANPDEALRLLDQAASKGHADSAKYAARLRSQMERAAAGLPPLPDTSGKSKPFVVTEGVYTVKAPNGAHRGTCTVRALGNDRYELAWNSGRLATGTVRGSGLYLDNAPGGAPYTILNSSRVSLLSSPQESLTLTR